MTPLPQKSAEIKVEWLGGDWPWVSCKLSPVFSPLGWLLTDAAAQAPCLRGGAGSHHGVGLSSTNNAS